jgi:hypothetical protein
MLEEESVRVLCDEELAKVYIYYVFCSRPM